MITVILTALIGNEVFPGLTGWWITYAVVVALFKLLLAIMGMVRTAKEW